MANVLIFLPKSAKNIEKCSIYADFLLFYFVFSIKYHKFAKDNTNLFINF